MQEAGGQDNMQQTSVDATPCSGAFGIYISYPACFKILYGLDFVMMLHLNRKKQMNYSVFVQRSYQQPNRCCILQKFKFLLSLSNRQVLNNCFLKVSQTAGYTLKSINKNIYYKMSLCWLFYENEASSDTFSSSK